MSVEGVLPSSSVTTVKDFNWEVKMAVSSDSLSLVNEPLVALQLTLARPDGDGTSRKVLELSREELNSLVDSLTKASDSIAAYTS